jgi:hypothetical protein
MTMSTHVGVSETGGRVRRGAEWLRVPQPALFLRLEIDRDLTVRKEPSFAYPVLTDFFPVGQPIPFEAEFLDDAGTRLSCTALREDCWHCDADCWPKRVRQTIGLPPNARKFRVTHDTDVIYEEDIPDPPKLNVACSYDAQANMIRVTWQATVPSQGQQTEDSPNLWYLVHYHAHGAWRGLAPRTQDTHADIDLKHLSLPATVPIRVLATSGIATGIGECAQEPAGGQQAGEGTLIATHGDPKDEPVPLGDVLRVHAVDEGGRSLPDVDIRWYDEAGRELTRGRDLDVTALGAGEQVVHAIATGSGGHPLVRTFVLHRPQPDAPCHLIASNVPPQRTDSPAHQHDAGEMHDH